MRPVAVMLLGLAVFGAGMAAGQGSVPAGSGPTASAPAEAASRPAGLPHLRINLADRAVEMDCQVALTEGALELLVCKAGTKEHESILSTSARPSHLHAALLALGLVPGRPARWTTGPDGKPLFAPPAGAMLEVSLRYTPAPQTQPAAPGAKALTLPARQWMTTVKDGKAPPALRWVFVGSALLETSYWADSTGDVISVSNFPDSVIDVPFESTADNAQLEFAANTAAIPPKGTPVTVVIRALPGWETAPVARAEFEVDDFGRCRLEGLAISPDRVAEWARAFRASHEKAFAVVHASARAMLFDVERLKALLAEAGIADVEVEMASPAGEVLPRTPQQADESLRLWGRRFADYRELLEEPGLQAEAVLRQIERRRGELAATSDLWGDYSRQLDQALRAYRAATQPASAPAPVTTRPSFGGPVGKDHP